MKIKSAFCIACMALLFSNCYYDNEEELYENFPQDCETTGMTYIKDIKPIFVTNCEGCHSQAGGFSPHLDTYQNVRSNEMEIMNRITRAAGAPGAMPQSGPLPDCTIDKIREWYADGAPQ